MTKHTRRLAVRVLIAGLVLPIGVAAKMAISLVGAQPNHSVLLPNGQTITPAGTQIEVNDRPLAIAISPDGAQAAVATASNFAPNALQIIDLASLRVAQTLPIGNSFVGLAYAPGGDTLYVGGGADNNVKIFTRNGGTGLWASSAPLSIPGSSPSGLSLSPAGDKLYVALNRSNALGIIDTSSRAVVQVATGAFPYTTVTTADGQRVYVSNWGGRLPQAGDATDGSNAVVVDPATGIANNGTISVYDTTAQRVVKQIQVGLHPSGMSFSPDGSRLYVTNSNSDSVSVIDTARDVVESTIEVRLGDEGRLGSAPNAITVSHDGQTLYIASGGTNAIAVVETGRHHHHVRGFIPVGWFPTAVALTANGDRLLVGNGYGFGSIAPAPAGSTGRRYQYRTGEISVVNVPIKPGALDRYTDQVVRNNRTLGGGQSPVHIAVDGDSPVPHSLEHASPIRHIIYIIKENRTYDQVFGDMPQGNGSPDLAIFGRTVTPNLHALAEQFVLLDNYYTAGDQSSLGHQWCDEAYANDYAHKYGNARNDFAGTNPMAFAPTGFLWDNARRHGKSARIYGEFTNRTVVTPSNATWTNFYTAWKNGTTGPTIVGASSVKSAQPITSPIFPGYDLRIPEQVRTDLFLQEFREFERNHDLPELIIMLLPMDHTQGTSPGFPTPRAMVADNDLAIGRIVDAVSHSHYWPTTAIFTTEDDAQDGADHVDGHRSEALVISPYTRRGVVDSTLYTTVNLVRTIEQILGLAPMNQFDSAAVTMAAAFSKKRNLSPFTAVANEVPLDEMNTPVASLQGPARDLALASLNMDFSEPDNAPADILNRVIWHSVKGYQAPYPSIQQAACIPAIRKPGAGLLE